jgi:hypothetical protein
MRLYAFCRALLLAAATAALACGRVDATALNALSPASGINATDTIPVCQVAAGCGASNPLLQMPLASVIGTVGSSISGTTTLGNSQNNETIPVTGTGYTITFPASTSSTLPPGSRITLAAASGASVDVCVASGSIFDANSTAPLTSSICASGNGVVLAGGDRLEVKTETGNNYLAAMSVSSGGGGGSSWAVDTTKTASYSILAGDASHVIPMSCIDATCTATLPASGTFAAGTQVIVENVSNATAVPIAPVGTPAWNSTCSGSSCSSYTETYTANDVGDTVLVDIIGCGGSNCDTTPVQSVESVVSTLGNSCSKVVGPEQQTASGTVIDVELWKCAITVTGADTLEVTFTGTVYYGGGAVSEWSGMASSPVDASLGTTGLTAAPQISVSPTERGDLVYGYENQSGGWNVTAQTLLPTGETNAGTPWASEYLLANGASTYTLNWTAPSTPPTPSWAAVAAAFKPANPVSIVTLCPGSGTSIAGTPAVSGCVPLVPGMIATVTVNAAGNYAASPQGTIGGFDDATASFTPSVLNCYETTSLLNYLSTIIVTIPDTLPSGCVLNFIQGGSQPAQIHAGSGVQLGSSGGNAHTGGQFAPSFVMIGGGGANAYFGGATAP